MDLNNIETEERLLSLCICGNEQAWAYLVNKFSGLICKAIRYKAARCLFRISQDDLDEIYQQTFAHIWCNKALSKINNPHSIPAYLAIIAQNITADFLRRKRRNNSLSKSGADYQNKTIDSDNPRKHAYSKQLSAVIDRYIQGLTIKEKRIITLDLDHDLKHREIAMIMDMPVNTVSTLIFRIKKALKKELEEKGYDLKEWS